MNRQIDGRASFIDLEQWVNRTRKIQSHTKLTTGATSRMLCHKSYREDRNLVISNGRTPIPASIRFLPYVYTEPFL